MTQTSTTETTAQADRQPTTTTGEPPRRSPYSAKAKIGRILWGVVSASLWRLSPPGWHVVRRFLLNAFGARVGARVRIHPSVKIEIPWHLDLGDDVRVCEHAILYCLGPVRVGAGTLIGPYAHLCAGTHDYTDPKFTLLREPIEVGSGCALLTASFVAPGVVVGDGAVLEPRAGLYRDAEPATVYAGNPAKPRVPRPAPPSEPQP